VLRWLTSGIPGQESEQQEHYELLRRYERGEHRRQLKVKSGQPDDNIALNFAGLVVDRTVSMLFGGGIQFSFDFPTTTETDENGKPVERESEQELYLDAVWNANKQQIFLHKLGYFGAVYGTVYVKIIPESLQTIEGNTRLPRLVALNPNWLSIETDPEDMERITAYVMEYKYMATQDDGQADEVARKEVISHEIGEELVQVENKNGYTSTTTRMSETGNWLIQNFISSRLTSGKWQQVGDDVVWPYPFAPVVHWQNLPDPESCYGVSDIEDVLAIQDRVNFVNSNVSKIIRFYAHPMRWGRGVAGATQIDLGPDKMVNLTGSDSMIGNLEMASDLASSRAFALDLRQALFDISRTIDTSSLADKIGALTNFGLRVLFMDALNKNATKQELYGDALTELNHRLLALAGFEGAASDGGSVVWADPLPVDRASLVTAEVNAVGAQIESRETAAENIGNDWALEEERMRASAAGQANIGEMLLQSFSRGEQ